MKLKMDLLPKKYKCIRKDRLGILILIVTIIFSIIGTFVFSAIKNSELEKLKKQSLKKVTNINSEISKLKKELLSIQAQYSSNKFQVSKKIALAERCIKFNKMKKNFSWYKFFETLENVTPEMIWVKDIYVKDFPKIVLCCETDKSLTAMKFYRVLLYGDHSQYFENVSMGLEIFDPKTYSIKFTMSFVFLPKGK